MKRKGGGLDGEGGEVGWMGIGEEREGMGRERGGME